MNQGVHPNLSNPGSPDAKVASEIAKVLPRDSELVTLEQQTLKPVPGLPPSLSMSQDELAPVILARAHFNLCQSKLAETQQALGEARELATLGVKKLAFTEHRNAAAAFMGERVEESLRVSDDEVAKARKARATLATVAVPGLEERLRSLEEALVMAASQVRLRLVQALQGMLRRRVEVYCQQAIEIRQIFAEMLTLSQFISQFSGKSELDPGGQLTYHSKLVAPALEVRPKHIRVTVIRGIEYLLEGEGGEVHQLHAKLAELLRVDLKARASLSVAEMDQSRALSDIRR